MPRIEWWPAKAPEMFGVMEHTEAGATYYPPPSNVQKRPMCDFCSYEARPVYLVEGATYATICGFIIRSNASGTSMPGDWVLCRGCQARCRIKEGDTWVPLEVVKRVWLLRQRPVSRYHLKRLGLPANAWPDEQYSFMEV